MDKVYLNEYIVNISSKFEPGFFVHQLPHVPPELAVVVRRYRSHPDHLREFELFAKPFHGLSAILPWHPFNFYLNVKSYMQT